MDWVPVARVGQQWRAVVSSVAGIYLNQFFVHEHSGQRVGRFCTQFGPTYKAALSEDGNAL
jgi:hypothetical protein